MFEKYYTILGLMPNASRIEVKRAYRKLAKKYHPDISEEPNARDHFVAITQAYDAIMDRRERPKAQYTFYNQQQRKSSYRSHVHKRNQYRSERQKRAQRYSEMKFEQFESESRYDHPYPIIKFLVILAAICTMVAPFVEIGISQHSFMAGFSQFLFGAGIIGVGMYVAYRIIEASDGV